MHSISLHSMSAELVKLAQLRVVSSAWFAQLSPEDQEKLAGLLDTLGHSRFGRGARGMALGASLANPIGEAVEHHGLADTADAGQHAVAERQAEHAVQFRQQGRGAIGTAAGGTPPAQTRPAFPTATANPSWRTGLTGSAQPRSFIAPHIGMPAPHLPAASVLPTAAAAGAKLKLPGPAVASNVTKPMGLGSKLLKVKL